MYSLSKIYKQESNYDREEEQQYESKGWGSESNAGDSYQRYQPKLPKKTEINC